MIKLTKQLLIFCTLVITINVASAASKDIENGYNYQAQKNNHTMESKKEALDSTYNFKKLSEDGKLPPSIICRDQNFNEIQNFDFKGDVTCSVIYPTRSLYNNEKTKEEFSWKDIVIIKAKNSEKVVRLNADFNLGVDQANEMSEISLIKLNRMYKGMMLYKTLELKGLVKLIKEN